MHQHWHPHAHLGCELPSKEIREEEWRMDLLLCDGGEQGDTARIGADQKVTRGEYLGVVHVEERRTVHWQLAHLASKG